MFTSRLSKVSSKWKEKAACRGYRTNMFYPELNEDVFEIKQHCLTCPVRRECLAYALDYADTHGIWGMSDPRERRRIIRMRERDDQLWLDFIERNDEDIFELCHPVRGGIMSSAQNAKR